jgi:DNA-binding NtrC family response regulator/Flp pilus assembly protein TadD
MAGLSEKLDGKGLDRSELALQRCRVAAGLERDGDYEGARASLSGFWHRIGERPEVAGLEPGAVAEVLLRTGSLSSSIGSARQIQGSQDIAKDLLSESASIFTDLKNPLKVAEAYNALGVCYYREGALNEARITLHQAVSLLANDNSELKARVMFNSALVESVAGRLSSALDLLIAAAPLFETGDNHALNGNYYNTLAITLKNLGAAENRQDYIDRALIEFAASSYHYEKAGHPRNVARVENNLGFLYLTAGKTQHAHEHLDIARQIFSDLKDSGNVAQVDETRARAFLAERRPADAERVTRTVIQTLDSAGQQGLLAEALTTHGTALARLGLSEQARPAFERAIEIALQAGQNDSAGVTALTMLEELGPELSDEQRRIEYERADGWITKSAQAETVQRLRICARRILAAQTRTSEAATSSGFVYSADETAALVRVARRVSTVNAPILISGETGTGKEELARLIHEWSRRAGEFVVVDCLSLAGHQVEARIFGYRQAGPDSENVAIGEARRAQGGTLLLDEITGLSLADQGKLVRFIEHSEIHPIGAPHPERADIRVIVTTSHNLKDEVDAGNFRSDLFYRLDAFKLVIPPLRERVKDIPTLAEHFLRMQSRAQNKNVSITTGGLEALTRLPLEGNARELRALIDYTVANVPDKSVLGAEAVEAIARRRTEPTGTSEPWAGCSLEEEVLRYEGTLIQKALETSGGSVTRAARLLGITHQGLAFILQGRQRNLLASRTPAKPRRRSLMRPQNR